MSITIADVAARAGVSKTTVSRVLNGKGELDLRTAERVRAVIAELGYVPSARAVGLARGRTRVVGMLVPSLTWPWMGEVLQGAVDVVESEGYGLLLFTFNRGAESMHQFASQVSSQSFDGLLVIEPEGTLTYIEQLHARGLPVVLIDDRDHRPQFPSVATTNYAGGQSAARHLIELGRHRPLVITGVERFGCTHERLDGFRDTYAEAGIELDPRLVFEGDFTHESGRRGVQHALDQRLDFDAVFAHNDLSAGGAIQAVRETGRNVPNDVSVVGFDDIPYAQHTEPPLTTVHQPMRQMGQAAARMLMGYFGGTPLPEEPQVLPTTLIVRSSTAPKPTPRTSAPAPAVRSHH
ncbi:LacI family transcriptional regulator [Kribbella antibiotica]|uniref:LacI family transcriptional regulator n=1 Tax=Kribbella antibiotica TaxID=190195 RepID=A0A4R4YW52_9ACTN|nr:LacI family DNA-binding transcriptional regulator [Kribbella antibiotica]TDD48754.1 LacI family transcriptional regulator [Kribbella antibiotica]